MADGFEIRTWETLTDEMINWIQANPDVADGLLSTDLNVGSLERAHLEAVALLMEEYDVRASQSMRWAIRESCLRAFGFSPLPAQAAIANVVFQALVAPLANITIPVGTRLVSDTGVQFLTTAVATILAGQLLSNSVQAQASVTGPDGNVAAGAISRIVYSISGVDAVNNPGAASGGKAEEGDADRLVRFQRYIKTLQRGTAAALEFAAMSTGLLVEAKAVEPFLLDPAPDGVPFAGLVWLVVDDGSNSGVLNGTVSTTVHSVVYGSGSTPGWKAAGVKVDLVPVDPVFVKIRAAVRVSPFGLSRWADIQTALTAAATAFFSAIRIGDAVSYQNLVVALTLSDPDILEVDLVQWLATDSVPSFGASMSADDIAPIDPANTYAGVNTRAIMFTGSADGVTYPYWYQTP